MLVKVYFTELVKYECEIEADSIEEAEKKAKDGNYDVLERVEVDRDNHSVDDSEEVEP